MHTEAWMTAPMDIPIDLRELYIEFGMAVEKAQVLEVEAVNVGLAYLSLLVKPGEVVTGEKQEFFRQIVEDANRQPLGTLLRLVKSLGSFDPAMIDTIDAALERRNYLIHHFFRTHNFAISSEAGRSTMIEEARTIRTQLERAIVMLSGVSSILIQIAGHQGLTQGMHDKLVSRGKALKL